MPQKAWSTKDERQYEKIKESARERGAGTERAKELAARTVNKRRRSEGRTRTSKASGRPKTSNRRTTSSRATTGRKRASRSRS